MIWKNKMILDDISALLLAKFTFKAGIRNISARSIKLNPSRTKKNIKKTSKNQKIIKNHVYLISGRHFPEKKSAAGHLLNNPQA